MDALLLSLRLALSVSALLLVLGIPIAYWLAFSKWRGKFLLESLVALPLVLPPTVLGFYALLALGPRGPLGKFWIALFGHGLAFTFTGLLFASVLYSFPFAVQPLIAAFESVDRKLLDASALLGAGKWRTFRRVIFPLSLPGVITALVLSFAHTLGEFGVVLMVGGNLAGVTRTVSIDIYDHVQSLEYAEANRMALVLLFISFAVLSVVYAVNRRVWTLLVREMTPTLLTAQFSKSHPASGGPPFVLNVALEAPAGFTILFGSSGAGKSTLLDCIAGTTRPDNGRILLNARTLFDSTAATNLSPQQRNLAYVFQTLALFPHLTVEANVSYGLSHLPKAECNSRVTEILQLFRIDPLRSRKPDQISGGERQRVALARALVTNPQALLLDEPLIGLDAGLKSALVNDLRAWNASRQILILYVTHSREEVDALGERVIALENGKVVATGSPREVLDAPGNRHLAYAIGFENILQATILELRPSDGVMRVALGTSACEIEVPLGHTARGDHLHVAVRAGDILLATAKPVQLSARNILEGNLESLEQRGSIVVGRVNCGAPFVVHITPSAVRSLALAPGQKVWLILKTHSCHLV